MGVTPETHEFSTAEADPESDEATADEEELVAA